MQAKFNKAYLDLIRKLPPSVLNGAWTRIISRKRNPITEEEASGVNPMIEEFLKHEVERYQKKIKSQCRSWRVFEELSDMYNVKMPDQENQSKDSIPISICNHEEEINSRVKKEVEIIRNQLLEFNSETFGGFMQKLDKEYKERINANKELRCEVEQQRLQLQEAEKTLASLKAGCAHLISK